MIGSVDCSAADNVNKAGENIWIKLWGINKIAEKWDFANASFDFLRFYYCTAVDCWVKRLFFNPLWFNFLAKYSHLCKGALPEVRCQRRSSDSDSQEWGKGWISLRRERIRRVIRDGREIHSSGKFPRRGSEFRNWHWTGELTWASIRSVGVCYHGVWGMSAHYKVHHPRLEAKTSLCPIKSSSVIKSLIKTLLRLKSYIVYI